jgi:tetratricopeptide (TPR) repeat protein
VNGAPGRVTLADVRLLVLLILLAGSSAWAQSKRYPPAPVDKDEDEANKSNLWEKATNPQRKPYEDLLAEAQTALDEKSVDSAREAITKLTEAIKLIPDDPRGYRARGDAHTKVAAFTGAASEWLACAADFTDAILHIKRSDNDPKGLGEMRRKLGLCQARAGKLAEAERTLSDAAAGGSSTGEVWVRLGEVRIAMGKLDEAIAALESAGEQTDVSRPLVYWLLMGAYDRARKPAMAAEMGRFAIEGNPADGSRKATDREMTMLKNPQMPLLGVGESEYLQALASAHFDPARPEYGLIYFRRFLQIAPDSPWRKRAEEHLKELKTAEFPEYVDQRGGSATFDKAAARVAVRKTMPQLRACLAKTPGMIVEVTITKSGPRSSGGELPYRRGAPPEGVTSTVRESIDNVTVAERDAAIRCLEPIADRLRAQLPAIKEKDTWYRAQFLIVSP